MNSKNKVLKHSLLMIILFISILLFELSGCSLALDPEKTAQAEDTTDIDYHLTILSVVKPVNIYTLTFQEAVQSEIESLKADQTPAKPLLIMDPFGTNILSLYAYFNSINECYVRYRINAQIDSVQTPEFSRKVDVEKLSKKHEFKMIGLVPDVSNDITIELFTSSNKKVFSHTFTVKSPKLAIITNVPTYPKKFLVEKSGTPSDGLFITSGQTFTGFLADSSLMIDNDGIIRGQITFSSCYNPRIEFLDDNIVYACSYTEIAVVNKLGKVEKLFNMEPYSLHHDFLIDENNLLILVDGNGQFEDLIYKINMDTNSGGILLNLRTFFPGYDFTDNSNDWLHNNGFSLVKETNGTRSLLISGREISAIIKVNDIYRKNGAPYIKYLITDNGNLDLYAPTLDRTSSITGRILIPNLGQHSVNYAGPQDDGHPGNGKYYVHFYNNNFTGNQSGINWSIYLPADVSSETSSNMWVGPRSMFEMYLVDEINGICELVRSIDVSYSAIMSSAQSYDENYIIGSATKFNIYEYDKNGNILLKISYDNDNTVNQPIFYRVFKYNM
jgi:arylsulfate sulfotransferase